MWVRVAAVGAWGPGVGRWVRLGAGAGPPAVSSPGAGPADALPSDLPSPLASVEPEPRPGVRRPVVRSCAPVLAQLQIARAAASPQEAGGRGSPARAAHGWNSRPGRRLPGPATAGHGPPGRPFDPHASV